MVHSFPEACFALERPGRSRFELAAVEGRLTAQLTREGYEVVTRSKTGGTVESLLVGVPGLLHGAGLSRSSNPAPRSRSSGGTTC